MAALKKHGIKQWKSINLSKGNFSIVTFNSMEVLGYVRDSTTAVLDVQVAEFVKYIAGLSTDPLNALIEEAQQFVSIAAPVRG